MYNFVTEELIKKIPHVEGFTEELLPVIHIPEHTRSLSGSL